ncbi:diguanylate cyclase domain-containing protein [Pleomorphomonas sp. JP5]|uniref:sensor domain-containing diguanylate cyclase n=1 Tax=Pleomorphomonas sp. JP5 TaxID=2942998 RepID=UPI00204345FA|nr:diguanylate cyclase [Pleomorphomonas sp. JP5]MCM5557560.1 diguanylate cyclase [Pleomorphomonas sp. JP5]
MRTSLERVQDMLLESQADAENVASSISISNSFQNTSPEQCSKRLASLKSLYTSIDHLSILTPKAIVYCSSAADVPGIQVKSSSKLFKSVHNNGTYWGDPQVSHITQNLVIPSVTAIRNNLDVDYLVVASLKAETVLNKALSLFDVTLAEAALISTEGGNLISLLLSTGEPVIGGELVRKSLNGYLDVRQENLRDDRPYYVGTLKLPMNNARFLVLSSLKEANDRAWQRLRTVVLTSVAETVVLAAIMMLLAEFFFIRNLRRIGALAGEITAGKQGQRISIRSPIADFNRLTAALNLMVDTLEDTSLHDALTGIANRRALDGHLGECDRLLAEGKGPMAVAMVDIDNFKLFNDRYGHAAGDRTLRSVGQTLKRFGKRQGEMVARYGGEEFTLVVGDSDPDQLRAHLDAFRRAVEELNIPHRDSPHGRVTVSVGYAVALPGTSMQQAIERADEALYRSKDGGRNRVSGEEQLCPA